jgi:AcrR family transcriptional regulator
VTARVNQKRRTRAGLLAAARDLLEQGKTPTVAEVADAALVSRATAYRYFPSQEHLVLEVVLERSTDELDRSVRRAVHQDSADERVDALVRVVHGEVAANEQRFRDFIRLSVGQAGDDATIAALRGTRRVRWIEHALEPLAGKLDEAALRRLASALALCTGSEPFVVLRDLCGLPPDEVEETLRWAARAMLAAAVTAP